MNGEVVSDRECEEEYQQMELFELNRPVFRTTGCKRTGCISCGYGCHLEKEGEGRFEMLKKTHPKMYDYIMREPKPITVVDPETGKEYETEIFGLNYKNIIDWINEHGGTHIRY